MTEEIYRTVLAEAKKVLAAALQRQAECEAIQEAATAAKLRFARAAAVLAQQLGEDPGDDVRAILQAGRVRRRRRSS